MHNKHKRYVLLSRGERVQRHESLSSWQGTIFWFSLIETQSCCTAFDFILAVFIRLIKTTLNKTKVNKYIKSTLNTVNMIPWWTGGEAAVSEQELVRFTGYTVITVVSTAWCTFHVALNTLLLVLVYIVTTRTRGDTRLIWWMTKTMCTRHYIMHVWLMHNKLKNLSCARLLYNKCY